MHNIFIIDEKGEIKQLNNSYKKNYSLLNEIVYDLLTKAGLKVFWDKKSLKPGMYIGR